MTTEQRKIDRSIGNARILDSPKIALDTYDLANLFREERITVISGFYSPMEEKYLRILLRSLHPVIWCMACGSGDGGKE